MSPFDLNFLFPGKKNSKNKNQSKKKSQFNNSHLLKPQIHDNFSQDPDLAIIFIDLNSQPSPPPPLPLVVEGRNWIDPYTQLFTQNLKKLNLKKNLILFSPDLSQAKLNLNKNSKNISCKSDQIIAMTERTGGWLLRSGSGETYPVQHCLLILNYPSDLNLDSFSLTQTHNLLLQNLSTQGYLIPNILNYSYPDSDLISPPAGETALEGGSLSGQRGGIQSGIKLSDIGASLSDNPRISQKLFVISPNNPDQNPNQNPNLEKILLEIFKKIF